MHGMVIIAFVAAIGFGVAGCEQPTDDPAHVHQWEWTVITPATCIATGEEEGVCKLDPSHTTTREIAIDLVNGHDWDFDNAEETVAPTCTTKGSGTAECKRVGCNETNTGTDNIPALGHDYQTYTEKTAPTCSAVGKEEAPCTRDSNHEKGIRDIAINPDAHNWKNTYTVTTPATCSAMGIETDICNLNDSHTRTKDIAIDSDNHNYGNWITTAPTCTTTGIDTRTCSLNATHKETRNETVALGHDWNTETGLCGNNCGELYYNLGDIGPGGGNIFYRTATGFTMTDDNTTAHYLEAAPADIATGLEWASSAFLPPDFGGTGNYVDITGTETAIGTGRKNTVLILATDANAPAAKACNDYSNGGKTDWFLPSKDELNQLYVNRTSVGSTKNDFYFSSSQYNSEYAWSLRFVSGNQSGFSKYGSNSVVRAVRAF